MFDDFKQQDDVYVRVSTTLQSVNNQLLEVYNYCDKERIYDLKKIRLIIRHGGIKIFMNSIIIILSNF
jgi:hypothetical protein